LSNNEIKDSEKPDGHEGACYWQLKVDDGMGDWQPLDGSAEFDGFTVE